MQIGASVNTYIPHGSYIVCLLSVLKLIVFTPSTKAM